VQVIGGKVGGNPIAVEGVEVGRRVSLHHNSHRAEQRRVVAILGGRRRAGGIRNRTGPEQNQTVDRLRLELIL
jgi:hypothetical protein